MSSVPELYDANTPSGGFTVDTEEGPVDMIAVLRHVNGETDIPLTLAERSVAKRLDPTYRRHGFVNRDRAEAYRRLARTLIDAA